jgi:DNA-binding CsgD family transcriptional regulator
MPTPPSDPLAAGGAALAAGDWVTARDAFRRVLDGGDVDESGVAAEVAAEALLGLAGALWWLGELHEAIELRERAYAAFQRRGDVARAAFVAWQLSLDHADGVHRHAAGQGWLARARRLVEDHGLEPVRGWVQLVDAHFAPDPGECERLAGEALEHARAAADVDLQLCALSQLGAALVDQGRVAEGVRMLDEAMAGSVGGEVTRPDPVVFTSCNTLQACTACADFPRALQWLQATDRFLQRFGSPYVRADCRIHYAAMLVATGDWVQAEEELELAVSLTAGTLPVLHGDALIARAGLRLAQGRVEEAARLVNGLEGRPGAAAVLGGVYLRQDRPHSACSVLQRALATLGADRLQAMTVRELLGEALIGCGDDDTARQHATAMVDFGAAHDCTVATAFGRRLCGRVRMAAGDDRVAREYLDGALADFLALGMPYEAARARLLLAQALRGHSPQAAVDEARVALAALDGLGARGHADAAAALLRALGATAPRTGVRGLESLTRREREVLALLGEGLSNPEIAERLYLSRKTVEHHVARVLSTLGLRSRAEAAAEAVRRLP